jgi:hypothetical protein
MFAQIPDIVINEIFYDASGSDDSLFTELYGPDGASLDGFYLWGINGNDGSVYRTIPLSGYTIPSDSFFVVASEDIGVQDIIASVDWQNGSDNVLLVHISGIDTTIVDAVGYGEYDTGGWIFEGEGIPTLDCSSGYSIYRFLDGDDTDNNIVDFIAYFELTPGAPNFGPPITHSISDIQGGVSSTPLADSLIEVIGVITAASGDIVFIHDLNGQWNGIRIFDAQSFPYSIGDSIKIVGVPTEYNDETQISNRSMLNNYGPALIMPDPYLTTPGDIDTNEANEGVLVELNMVNVTDNDIGFGEWLVSDGVDTCVVDDYYNYITPDSGDIISIIRGPVSYTFGAYKIEPRGNFDILSFDESVDSAYVTNIILMGDSVYPYCWIRSNLDAPLDSFFVYFEVDAGGFIVYRDSVYSWVDSSNTEFIQFPGVAASEPGPYHIRYFTSVNFDVNPSNDTLLDSVLVIPKIAINEIFYDTDLSGDSTAFTELFGPDSASMDSFYLWGVNGYDGSIYSSILLSGNIIPSDSFFVVGSDNGVSNVDLVDTDVDWQNGSDNIILVHIFNEDTTVVDAVGYGDYDTTDWTFTGEGMPAPDAYEKPLYRYPDGYDTDNNIDDFIIFSEITPGFSNYGPPVSHSIAEIQGMDLSTPYEDSLVEVTGVITASDGYDVFMQDAFGQWNGITVFGVHYDDYILNQGDSVSFVCIPSEHYDMTQLEELSRVKNFGPSTFFPDPFITTTGDIDTNEANEGVLVELNLLTVVDPDIGNGEWLISDGVDTCIVDDYYLYTTPDSGDIISILRGPVAFTYGDYKVEPRGDFDILSFDLTIDSAFTPDTISLGDTVTPYCWVRCAGDAPEDSFYVYFVVDSAGVGQILERDSVYTWIDTGNSQYIEFNEESAPVELNVFIRYFTSLGLDINTSNDTLEHYTIISGISEEDKIPATFELAVPGISFGIGSIEYSVPERSEVSISLFDKLGRRVNLLVDKVQNPGYYQIRLERLNLPSDVYFIKMASPSFESIKKMTILK